MNIETSITNKYQELKNRITSSGCELSYLNLGYWNGTLNTKAACQELINQFFLFAEIGEADHILDVGVGYGEQLAFLLEKYPLITIHGIDVLKGQIELATEKLSSSPNLSRVKLEVADAIDLSDFKIRYDQVIAIESAFHFNTREKFFKEAYAVLKPGGKLALADVIISKELISEEIVKKFGVPIANAYNINTYVDLIKGVGFKGVKVKDISKYVLPFSALEIMQNNGWRTKEILSLPDDQNQNLILNRFLNSTAIESYYFISAIK